MTTFTYKGRKVEIQSLKSLFYAYVDGKFISRSWLSPEIAEQAAKLLIDAEEGAQ